MAVDNQFKETVDALFKGMNGVVSSKTVVGDAIHIGDTICAPGKKFVFEGTSPASNPSQIFVNTKVPMPEGKPVSVKWRVYNHNGKLKIIDIIIENVSLAQTARNEYTSFIAKSPKGVEGLLENLRTKIKQ